LAKLEGSLGCRKAECGEGKLERMKRMVNEREEEKVWIRPWSF
jgi:hypothetical protein